MPLRRKFCSEISLNKLDEDVERLTHSLNFVFNLFLASKYKVQNSRIYPRGRKYQILAFCCILFLNALCIYRIFTVDITDLYMGHLESDLLSLFAVFYFVAHLMGFTTLFILDYVHKYNYVLLILDIQTVHRSIGLSKSIKSFITWNLIITTSFIFINIIISAMYYTASFYYYDSVIDLGSDSMFDIMFTTLDVSLVTATRIIILLTKYLDEWVKQILTMNDEHENEEYCQKMFGKYKIILKTYELYKKIYHVLFLYFTISAIYRNLVIYHLMLYTLKVHTGPEPWIRSAATIIWMTKNIVLITVFSIYCEKFYMSVDDAESACIQLMKNRNCPKSQERLFEKVLQARRTFSKMTACGMFYIDATLPILLMGVFTNYNVILLQYNFL